MRKIKQNKTKTQSGFMMLEILVIASILVVVILGSASVAKKAVEVSSRNIHLNQANFLLEEGAEAVRILRDNDWSNISLQTAVAYYYATFNAGTWSLSQNMSTNGIFTRRIVFEDVYRDATTQDIVTNGGVLDSGTRLVTITVGWLEGDQQVSKSLKFYITDLF